MSNSNNPQEPPEPNISGPEGGPSSSTSGELPITIPGPIGSVFTLATNRFSFGEGRSIFTTDSNGNSVVTGPNGSTIVSGPTKTTFRYRSMSLSFSVGSRYGTRKGTIEFGPNGTATLVSSISTTSNVRTTGPIAAVINGPNDTVVFNNTTINNATFSFGTITYTYGYTNSSSDSSSDDSEDDEDLIDSQLDSLNALGFPDRNRNRLALKRSSGDLNRALDSLLTELNADTSVVHVQPTQLDDDNESSAKRMKLDATETESDNNMPKPEKPDMEECKICFDEFETSSSYWRVLPCSHKLCGGCYVKIETKNTTMSGVNHSFIRCPFCRAKTGLEMGTCPDGRMTVKEIRDYSCTGHEGLGTFRIRYIIPSYGLRKRAYLPMTDQGKRILKLLRIAWDRRLIFSVDAEGEEDLFWNIPHKTAMWGGKMINGFPDNTYFERTLTELKSYGIE